MSVNVRAMESHDCEALAAIYNQVIDERVATFNTEHVEVQSVATWIDSDIVLVAENETGILGYVRSFPYRTRPCYAGVAQFSIYVDGKVRGLGVGDLLMSAFIDALLSAGKWKVLSRVFPENEASLSLLRKHGFREVGLYRNHAMLDGDWRDVVIVERLLGAGEE